MTNTSAARPVLNGRYELHRRIARGGMADVFLAKDQLLDRPVAVKVLFPQYASDPTFVARFRREAQAAANLNHPNIVSVYDWGEHDGTYFIVMEYVEGQTLADRIANHGPLDPRQAAGIATEVAVALGFAHRNGTVHRDVKPGNIMLNTQGQVKVADFGIARAFGGADEELTQTGSVMGTASYFSPEQAQGKKVDPRSDLYSLGVVLFEMVVGQTPFNGNTPVAIAYKHVQEAPPRAAALNPAVPPALDALISQLLRKDPAERYRSAEELRADLIRFQEGKPLLGVNQTASTRAVSADPYRSNGASDSTMVMSTTGQNPAYRNPDTGSSRAVIDTSRAVPASAAVSQVEPVEEYYEPPSRTGVFVVMLGLLLVGLVGLIWYLSNLNPGEETDPNETALVAVPDVAGMRYSVAQRQLQDDGFEIDLILESNPDVPENQVFATVPPAGTELEEGAVVRVFVSKPADVVTIPPLIGQNQADAESTLRNDLKVNVTIKSEWSNDVAQGMVIGTKPEAGTTIPAGKDSTVTLIVSQGPEEKTVPDVSRQLIVNATNILTEAGFTNQVVAYEGSAIVEKDQVIRTEPASGQPAQLKGRITVYVSDGAKEVQVPNIFGKDLAAATEALQAAQLSPNVQYVQVPAGDPGIGLVVNVQPAPGSLILQGQQVTIQVGQEGPPDTTTSTTIDPNSTNPPDPTASTDIPPTEPTDPEPEPLE